MLEIDTTDSVMITGSTGFVAGWIVKGLLEAGVEVHAPVRSPDNPEKLKYLNAIADKSEGEIKFFGADLLDEGSYADAMAGCSIVFHTASPYTVDVKDPQTELIDPAQLGTRNVLEEVDRTASVKRVVLTSSCTAIYGDNADLKETPNSIFTEDIWNKSSSLEHQPYAYSKTLAEKEAWKIADAQSRWDLVVINPSLVIGPGINPHSTSESINIVRRMGDGSLKMGAPRWGFGMVDVRDLAKAHIAAAFTPKANGRYIINGHNTDLLAMAMSLLPKYGNDYPIPLRPLPKWLFWLVGPLAGGGITRRTISLNVDLPWKGDNSRSVRELGVVYRPMQESMEDMFQQMIEAGYFKEA